MASFSVIKYLQGRLDVEVCFMIRCIIGGKPGILKLYIGFKHLLFSFNLDILSCSDFLSVSELLNDQVFPMS